MSPTRLLFAAMAALGVLPLASAPARADMTLVQTTTISNPQITASLQSMSAQQRAQVRASGNPLFSGGAQTAKIYVQGQKSRVDYGGYTFIADSRTRQLLTINRATRTFSLRSLVSSQGPSLAGATLTDTHQTKTILGHVAHHYIVATANVTGAGSQFRADIWAAPDLPQPPAYGQGSGPMAPVQSLMRRVKGLPLQTTVMLAGTPLGTVTARAVTKSISMGAVSPTLFTIPAGFKNGPVGNLNSSLGMGGGLGR